MLGCFRDKRVSLNILCIIVIWSSIGFHYCRAETTQQLTGYILDDDKLPLQGVIVSVEEGNKIIKQELSDEHGLYSLELAHPWNSYNIQFFL